MDTTLAEVEREIPEDLLRLVLGLLPWQDVLRLRAVCKHWNSILRDSSFLKLWSPSNGVPLFLSSFPESDTSLYHRPGLHRCLLDSCFCPECDFQLFSPLGHQWGIFPKAWLTLFLHRGLSRTCTRLVRIVGVKGGIFLVFFRRQIRSGATAAVPNSSNDTSESSHDNKNIPARANREILFLVNPFNQTHRQLNLPSHLQARGSSLFWIKIKKMVENKQTHTFKILFGPWIHSCDSEIHQRCNVWVLDCYDILHDSWSKLAFHLGRGITFGAGQVVDVGFVYDATIVRSNLYFLTSYSDSLVSVWEFCPTNGSQFPARLTGMPTLNLFKPAIFESQGRLMLLGQSADSQFHYSIRLWQYDFSECRWVSVMSFLSDLPKACRQLRGDFGSDFVCIAVDFPTRTDYLLGDLGSRTWKKLPPTTSGRKIFILEPRLDIEL